MIVRSHNGALKEAYFAALDGITYNSNVVPVFSEMAPDDAPALYIIFSGISNTENSTKNSVDFNTTVDVSIYSQHIKYNSGKAVDDIADEVLQRLTNNLVITGFQNVKTEVVNDNTQTFRILNQTVAIDRLITFKHWIFQ